MLNYHIRRIMLKIPSDTYIADAVAIELRKPKEGKDNHVRLAWKAVHRRAPNEAHKHPMAR